LAADAEANRAQRRFLGLTAAQITIALLSGVAGVVALARPSLKWLGIATASAFPVITLLRLVQRRGAADARWYMCRGAAEAVKSIAWRYAVAADQFALHDPGVDARFDEQLRAVIVVAGRRSPVALTEAEITPEMRALRQSPRPVRTAAYQDHRLLDQLDWYRDRARRFDLIASRADRSFFLLSAVAIGAGVAGLWSKAARGVVAVAAAIIGVILGWVGTRGYGGLARAYAATATELDAVRVRLDDASTDADFSRLVDDAEQIIGRERSQWRAART
jgi:hypothetical protein